MLTLVILSLTSFYFSNIHSNSRLGSAFNVMSARVPCLKATYPAAPIIAALSPHNFKGAFNNSTSLNAVNSLSNLILNP